MNKVKDIKYPLLHKSVVILNKKIRFKESKSNTDNYLRYLPQLEDYFNNSVGTIAEKLENFAKYVPRQHLTNFLAKYEVFKKILHIQGSIIECGVFFGGGLMTFAQLSAIFEPVNSQRKIIGFDTFSGFPEISRFDKDSESEFVHKGGLAVSTYEDLKSSISLYDSNRFISHIPKVELIKGDATRTIPKYLKENPHTVISLLYLDFDIYKPTKVALESFVPRMPKGAVIVFDELNNKFWRGETKAVLDTMNLRDLKIERFSFNSYMSYAVLD